VHAASRPGGAAEQLSSRLVSLRRRDSGDPRDAFIARTVEGQSFADVGGLWGLTNEKVSVAHAAGASSVTMIDRVDLGDGLWEELRARLTIAGVDDIRCISADVLELGEDPAPPRFDVVHSSGVLYHLPDPVRFLQSLRRLTRKRVVLSSSVTGRRVRSRAGTLEMPASGMIFVPALAGKELAVVRAYWDEVVQGAAAVGINREAEWDPSDYTPWWWLPTIEALEALCRASGFVVEDGAPSWGGNAHTLLLRRSDLEVEAP
jgi:SAM-dependent methyltransferase